MPGPVNNQTAMLRAANWIRSILGRFDADEESDAWIVESGQRLADELSAEAEKQVIPGGAS
jgi:hypothetical protein